MKMEAKRTLPRKEAKAIALLFVFLAKKRENLGWIENAVFLFSCISFFGGERKKENRNYIYFIFWFEESEREMMIWW